MMENSILFRIINIFPSYVPLQLQTLRTNLTKDIEEDETVLNNTYDPAQGSPRYTKNRRREVEVSVKTNLSTTPTSGKKKSKRILPPPPLIQNEEEDDQTCKTNASVDEVGKQKKKSKKAKSTEKGGQKGEREPEDNLLQEYQQRITEDEERYLKKFTHRKHGTEPQSQYDDVLNNEKGEKKKNLQEREEDKR